VEGFKGERERRERPLTRGSPKLEHSKE
jgi:hypothetical protein